jgi:uncharacterized protein involved in outer membrane biogenesis
MTSQTPSKLHGKTRRYLFAAALVIAVYGLIGFFVSPGIIRTKAIERLSQATGRRVAIRELKVNPFSLSVTIRGFSIPDSGGEKCVGFEELYLNFNLSSIFRRAYTFGEFRIAEPYIHFTIRKGGQVNLLDLMPPAQPADTVSSKSKQDLPPLLLQKFVMERGQTVFEDRNRPTPFLTRLDSISFSLENLTTLPRKEGIYQFEAATDRGETMRWAGNVSIVPLQSKGNIRLSGLKARTIWAYLQDQLKFEVTSGAIGLSCDYTVDYAADSLQYKIENGSFELSDLTIADKAAKTEPLTLGSLKLQNIAVHPQQLAVSIGSIQSESGRFITDMDSVGTLSLVNLLMPNESVSMDSTASAPSPAWKVRIGRLDLKNYALQLADHSTNPVANWQIAPIDFSTDSLLLGAPAVMAMNLQLGINGSGTLALKGTVGTDPIQSDLEITVTHISLPDFQPYLNRFARLDLKSGTISSSGKLHYALRGEENVVDFSGDVSSDSLRATDRNVNQDLVRWQRLDVKQIAYHSHPASLTVHEIAAKQPYARFVLAADRTTNIENIMIEPADTTQVQSQEHTSVAVKAIRISRGILNFTDLSLSPNFTVSIESLNGSIKGLSSEQLARADVALEGKVDKYAPAEISGQINPLSEDAFTDIMVKFHGIELTTFAPYAGKYAGYRIDKGKLSLDLHYKLSKRFLEASNHVVMDQLTLGERVDSPDATSLPVKLAIALLKDRQGVIDLDIPVSGDLNDPKFKVMPLVFKVLVNLATKAVTAPFALLGSLFSGGDDLSYVSFLPGVDSLDVTQQPKLASLAKALTERPALQLDIRGIASDSADGHAIASAQVIRQIRGSEETIDTSPLTPIEQDKARKLYLERYHTTPDSLVPSVDSAGKKRDKRDYGNAVTEAAVQKLIAETVISEDDMRALARRRADAVKGFLILQGGIEDARLMLQDVQTGAAAQDGRISMPLSLNAR